MKQFIVLIICSVACYAAHGQNVERYHDNQIVAFALKDERPPLECKSALSECKSGENGSIYVYNGKKEYSIPDVPVLLKFPTSASAWRILTLNGNRIGMAKPSRNWHTPLVVTTDTWGHSPVWYASHFTNAFHRQYAIPGAGKGYQQTPFEVVFDGEGTCQFLSRGNEQKALQFDGETLSLAAANANDSKQQFRLTKQKSWKWDHYYDIAPASAPPGKSFKLQPGREYGQNFVVANDDSSVSGNFHIIRRENEPYYYIVVEHGYCFDVRGEQIIDGNVVANYWSKRNAFGQQWKPVKL